RAGFKLAPRADSMVRLRYRPEIRTVPPVELASAVAVEGADPPQVHGEQIRIPIGVEIVERDTDQEGSDGDLDAGADGERTVSIAEKHDGFTAGGAGAAGAGQHQVRNAVVIQIAGRDVRNTYVGPNRRAVGELEEPGGVASVHADHVLVG